jgi:hypothetical protein
MHPEGPYSARVRDIRKPKRTACAQARWCCHASKTCFFQQPVNATVSNFWQLVIFLPLIAINGGGSFQHDCKYQPMDLGAGTRLLFSAVMLASSTGTSCDANKSLFTIFLADACRTAKRSSCPGDSRYSKERAGEHPPHTTRARNRKGQTGVFEFQGANEGSSAVQDLRCAAPHDHDRDAAAALG